MHPDLVWRSLGSGVVALWRRRQDCGVCGVKHGCVDAWKAKKKAEGKWVENPMDEQKARWAQERKEKDEERERKKRGEGGVSLKGH